MRETTSHGPSHPIYSVKTIQLKTMILQAQRIAIAEACGYKKVGEIYCGDMKTKWATPRRYFWPPNCDYGNKFPNPNQRWGWEKPAEWASDEPDWRGVPDYLNDLNAIHRAWKTVIEPDALLSLRYYQNLCGLIENNPDGTVRFGVCFYNAVPNATAAQRAEAFLRTIGKWVPST